MIARPSATRCCWPPESCDGLRSSSASRPEQLGDALRAARAISAARDLAHRAGRTRCSRRPTGAETARSSGTPSRCCAAPAAGRVTSRPAMRMRPPSACSSPAMSRSVVDLPQPDGPEQHVERARSSANDSRSTARTWPSRGRPVLADVFGDDGRHRSAARRRAQAHGRCRRAAARASGCGCARTSACEIGATPPRARPAKARIIAPPAAVSRTARRAPRRDRRRA